MNLVARLQKIYGKRSFRARKKAERFKFVGRAQATGGKFIKKYLDKEMNISYLTAQWVKSFFRQEL